MSTPQNINCLTIRDKLRFYKKHPMSFAAFLLVCISAIVTVGILVLLVGF